MAIGRALSRFWTKSRLESAGSSRPCVSSVSRSTISNPLVQPTQSFDLRKCTELDSVGM